MTGTGSPCGACKFLRRKCVRGCVFAPYFRHEQGASNFAAIHKVFGASNVSKLLAHLPASDRCEAAVTIAYEAQARLQDPIYGCVSHIFALQQQVMSLQIQLASLREQAAAQSIVGSSGSASSPSQKWYGNVPNSYYPQDVQSLLLHQENLNMTPHLYPNPAVDRAAGTTAYGGSSFNMDPNSLGNYGSSVEENGSFVSYEDPSDTSMASLEDMQMMNKRKWAYQEDNNDIYDLRSVAYGHI